MVYCVVRGCKNASHKGFKIHFFKFPNENTDSVRRNEWIQRMRLQREEESWNPSNRSSLCSQHFDISSYERDPEKMARLGYPNAKAKLKSDALPTLFPKKKIDDLCRPQTDISDDASHRIFQYREIRPKIEKAYLREKKKIESEVKTYYQCHLCDEMCQQYSDLEIHYNKHTNQEPNNCNKPFDHHGDSSNLQSNMAVIQAKRRSFKCDVCNKTFNTISNRNEHTKIHNNIRPHKCYICSKSFIRKSKLKLHTASHNEDKPNKCIICGKSFVEEYKLQIHAKIHSEDKNCSCDVCGKTFNTVSYLYVHMKMHQNDRSHKCHICDKSFLKNYDLLRHVSIHSQNSPYKCDVCGETFKNTIYLNRHQKKHITESGLECDVCDNIFTTISNLNQHKKTHSLNEKIYKCHICCKSFFYHSKLQRHISTHSEHKPFKCGTCNIRFLEKCQIEDHVNIHTGTKPYACSMFTSRKPQQGHSNIPSTVRAYKCDVCGKTFNQTYNLKRHMSSCGKTNQNEIPDTCGVCGKMFSGKFYIQQHVKYHFTEKIGNLQHHGIHSGDHTNTSKQHGAICSEDKDLKCEIIGRSFAVKGDSKKQKEKPSAFKCEVCSKTFAKYIYYERHLLVHNGGGPTTCDVCNLIFANPSSLEHHMDFHLKHKWYTCVICSKFYETQDTLDQHMLVHNGEKPFKCEVCQKSFFEKSNLQRHMKLHGGH